MTPIDLPSLVVRILDGHVLSPWGIHGVTHWVRVMENGLKLAESTGANPAVVTLFALFHDSRRIDDGDDYGHGGRGAELASEYRGVSFDLPDAEFDLLYRACERHTGGRTDPDITVLTCWDADRLDLGRVGIMPDPRYLCTPAGRSAALIDWAHTRAINDFLSPRLDEWRLTPPAWR
jgi:uncharacterized protein